MGWSLGYSPVRESELTDLFLLSVGKALSLAIGFESKCKHAYGAIALVESLENGVGFDAALELIGTLQDKQTLNNAVNHACNYLGSEPEIIQVLRKARLARNWIAHESASVGCISDANATSILKRYSELRPQVSDLAKGDNIVSAWCYEISEKESAPIGIQNQYVELVLAWVFQGAPINCQGDWEWLSISPVN
jgi:hypothetical protein